MTHDTRVFLLKLAGEGLALFGLLFFLALLPFFSGVMPVMLDMAIWPILDGGQGFERTETRLLAAITGGLCVGMGVMIYLVAERVFRRDPALGRILVLWPTLAWFCVDSLGSVLAGGAANVIWNTIFLALVLFPVLVPAKDARFRPA